jgi:parallel beta-helix repeat protein
VGSDSNDGQTPATAWKTISKLGEKLHAGDGVYIGPGLYRENIPVRNPGTAERSIRFIADPSGQRTGDSPGTVMITGAEPFDETLFEPQGPAGVYRAPSLGKHVLGVVEMDGPQYRYTRATDTGEHRIDGKSPREVVAAMSSSFHYDVESAVFSIHTSDGGPPTEHEIEIIRRGSGITMHGMPYVTVVGFTLRHMGDAGISFFHGSDGGIAADNTAWGGRQGVRVYNSKDVLIYGNTLFRNDNSGVYFARQSTHGHAIDNIAYENVKGIRWGSESNHGLALGNRIFDNSEAGIALESVQGARVIGNHASGNSAQLLLHKSQQQSDGNCFAPSGADRLVASVLHTYKYRDLRGFQEASKSDLGSREGGCDLPEKVDVRELHKLSKAYLETNGRSR